MFNSNHLQQTAIEWFAKLKSPDLSQDEVDKFMHWLEESPEHQLAYLTAEQTWTRGNQLALVDEKLISRSFFGSFQLSATALILVAIVFFSFIYQNSTSQPLDMSTRVAEQKNVTLEDGSIITLNTRTKVSVTLDRNRREVFLEEGEIFLEVRHLDKKPFFVRTSRGSVRVYGTQFSVRVIDNNILVTVVEGQVGIGHTGLGLSDFEPLEILSTNQQLSYEQATLGVSPKMVSAKSVSSWTQKKLIFDGRPLSQVITELNRYSTRTVELSDADLADIQVTAVIKIDDIVSSIRALAQSLELHTKVDDNKLIVF